MENDEQRGGKSEPFEVDLNSAIDWLNEAPQTIIGLDSSAKLHFYCLKKHLSILISIKDEEIPYATKSIREMG